MVIAQTGKKPRQLEWIGGAASEIATDHPSRHFNVSKGELFRPQRSIGAGMHRLSCEKGGSKSTICALACFMEDETLDCLIIGGGPAGLTAAIYCSRYLLSTLVIEDGGGRARTIPRTHNHAGFPGGISGEDLLVRFRTQTLANGGRIMSGHVEALEQAGDIFKARTDAGPIRARTILIATGITDRRPAMDDALHDEALRAGLLRYCPICDGFEVRDKRVAVIGHGDHGTREAVFLRSYTRDVTLIMPEEGQCLSAAQRDELDMLGIPSVNGPATDFAIEATGLSVRTARARLSFDAIYPALGAHIHSKLAADLGARVKDGGCLIVDDHARTSVAGVYAAGDVVLGLDQISGAMGQAGLAATTIRNDLANRERRVR